MFENNPYRNFYPQDNCCAENNHARRYNTALSHFKSTLFKGEIFRMTSGLLRRRQWLYDLASIKLCKTQRNTFYAGIKVVDINRIIGTEGRMTDFDIGFHPVNEKSRQRWVNMALAYLVQLPLPPVELTQIGDAYFVRDGHHRISVARSFGQLVVDAEVVIIDAAPPFPWQKGYGFQPVQVTNARLSQ